MASQHWWDVTLWIFTFIVVLSVVGVAITTLVLGSERDGVVHLCGRATGDRIGSGSAGELIYRLSLDSNQRELRWTAQYRALDGVVTGLRIQGPIPYGQSLSPTLIYIPLCGMLSSLVCDTSVPAYLSGTIDEQAFGGTSLSQSMKELRRESQRYYINLITGAHPNGEVVDLLLSECPSE